MGGIGDGKGGYRRGGMHVLFLLAIVSSGSARIYNRLFEDLLGRYNKLVRPSTGPNDTVRIAFRLKLSELVDVHEREQVITTNGWLVHQWFDDRLSWKPALYGSIRSLHVPGELLWLPDIILYNNAHGSPHVSAITKAELRFDGLVTWKPPVVYNSMCKINVEWFPYDEQFCDLKFGSWTYSGTQLDLVHLMVEDVEELKTEDGTEWKVQKGIDLDEYKESVEFDLLSGIAIRHEKFYPCCDYPSIDITYYINIRRKKLFYTVNLIIPCWALATLTSFVFYLPCEVHQKLQLCISVLVSLAFFFLVLMDNIPPTSLCIPFIGKYLVFTMIMVTASVIVTVMIHNLHFRPLMEVPPWMRRVFIDYIGSRLYSVRGNSEEKRERKKSKRMNALNAMMILEKQFNKTLFHLEMATRERSKEFSATSELFLRLPFAERSKSVRVTKKLSPKRPSLYKHSSNEENFLRMINEKSEKESTAATLKLREAEKNVHYIAKTLIERRKMEENSADWKFLAIVIDRIFLVVFTSIIILGSIMILLSAPSLRDDRKPIHSTRL